MSLEFWPRHHPPPLESLARRSPLSVRQLQSSYDAKSSKTHGVTPLAEAVETFKAQELAAMTDERARRSFSRLAPSRAGGSGGTGLAWSSNKRSSTALGGHDSPA